MSTCFCCEKPYDDCRCGEPKTPASEPSLSTQELMQAADSVRRAQREPAQPAEPREWWIVLEDECEDGKSSGHAYSWDPRSPLLPDAVHVVPFADLLAAQAEIVKMRRTHNEWVSEQGERTRTRDEIIACLKKERDEALALLKGFALNRAELRTEEPFEGALAKLLDASEALLARHAKSGGTRDGDGGEG